MHALRAYLLRTHIGGLTTQLTKWLRLFEAVATHTKKNTRECFVQLLYLSNFSRTSIIRTFLLFGLFPLVPDLFHDEDPLKIS